METRVNIKYRPSDNRESFGEFTILFNHPDNNDRSVRLKFDMKQLWGFARDTSSVAFDFLILALIVYNTDRVINRQVYSIDGWLRKIILENVPVLNLDAMNRGKDLFNKAISFLTGDDWDINFVQGQPYDYSPRRNVQSYDYTEYEKVSLFSGGLDSLIGFIDEASTLSQDKKILLISHMELGKEKKDQEDIIERCHNKQYFENRFDRLLLNAGLRPKTWNLNTPTERTFRSRSLLFFAAGIYIANRINPYMDLIVPENGTISINIPLDKGRRSACGTRTTHPTFIRMLEDALESVGIHNKFRNPYQYKSKADMMADCSNDAVKGPILQDLTPLSCSCAKRGHNSFWDKDGLTISDNHINHCGMCLPCLYRRVALDMIGHDDPDFLGTDVLHGVRYDLNCRQKRNRDFKALLFFLKHGMDRHSIRTELIINGVTDNDELEKYVNLVLHSYVQVKEWLSKKASHEIKNMAGI